MMVAEDVIITEEVQVVVLVEEVQLQEEKETLQEEKVQVGLDLTEALKRRRFWKKFSST
jgi:hypothetical protein